MRSIFLSFIFLFTRMVVGIQAADALEGERFPAEDSYTWFQASKYRAIETGLDWHPAKYHEVSDPTVAWEEGNPAEN